MKRIRICEKHIALCHPCGIPRRWVSEKERYSLSCFQNIHSIKPCSLQLTRQKSGPKETLPVGNELNTKSVEVRWLEECAAARDVPAASFLEALHSLKERPDGYLPLFVRRLWKRYGAAREGVANQEAPRCHRSLCGITGCDAIWASDVLGRYPTEAELFSGRLFTFLFFLWIYAILIWR